MFSGDAVLGLCSSGVLSSTLTLFSPIYDTWMIWNKVLNGRFRADYRDYCESKKIPKTIATGEDTAEWYVHYMNLASPLLSTKPSYLRHHCSPLRSSLLQKARGFVSQAMIFAFKRTGRIVTARNKHLLAPEELREWSDAVDEYHRRVESGEVV
jgi:hypothetical protein